MSPKPDAVYPESGEAAAADQLTLVPLIRICTYAMDELSPEQMVWSGGSDMPGIGLTAIVSIAIGPAQPFAVGWMA